MAKRMRLVADSDFDRNQGKHGELRQAKEHFFHDERNTAASILDASQIPDDIKIHLYGRIMTGVRNQLDELLNAPVKVQLDVPKVAANDLDRTTNSIADPSNLQSSPSSFASSPSSPIQKELPFTDKQLLMTQTAKVIHKIRPLMQMLRENPKLINWDETGRVTFFENEFVANSNIIDLLNFTTRDLKWESLPPGTNRFIQVCKMINVPNAMLSREAKKGYMGDLETLPIRPTASASAAKTASNLYQSFRNWETTRNADKLDQFTFFSTPTGPDKSLDQSKVNFNQRRKKK